MSDPNLRNKNKNQENFEEESIEENVGGQGASRPRD